MPPQLKYSVELTQTAERIYRKLHEEAQACIEEGDETNSKVTQFRMLEDAIDKIIPHEPFNLRRALSGPLSNIFRVSKGRMRVFYAGSTKQHRIVILYISEAPRKAGDLRDPYEVFTHLVLSGRYDKLLEELGVRRPERRKSLEQPTLQ